MRKRSHETLCFISLLSQGAKWTPKSDFGLPKRTFGPFWAQNPILASKIALLGPESHFGAHFAPWPKRFIKQRVSGTFFRTLGAKMRKWAHFAHFGVPNWKMCSFSTSLTLFHPKRYNATFSTFEAIWSLLVPPPLLWEPSGRRLGEVWETAGRRLGGVWKASGRRPGAVWERFGGRLGDVWETSGPTQVAGAGDDGAPR